MVLKKITHIIQNLFHDQTSKSPINLLTNGIGSKWLIKSASEKNRKILKFLLKFSNGTERNGSFITVQVDEQKLTKVKMMLFENRNIANTFYIKKKNRKKYTDVGENFNILSHKYYEFNMVSIEFRFLTPCHCHAQASPSLPSARC